MQNERCVSIEQEEKETKVKYILVWVWFERYAFRRSELKEESLNKNYFNDNYRTIIKWKVVISIHID